MGLISFPFESNYIGQDEYGNPIWDRAVDSVFYHKFWLNYFTDGIFLNQNSDNFFVTAVGGMAIDTPLGECHIRGVTSSPDEETTTQKILRRELTFDKRIDRIVIRLDNEERVVTIEVRENWQPTDVLTRNANIWELAIADVLIRKNATSVQQVDITDLRLKTDLCGIVTEPIRRVNTDIFFTQLQLEMELVKAQWDMEAPSHQHVYNFTIVPSGWIFQPDQSQYVQQVNLPTLKGAWEFPILEFNGIPTKDQNDDLKFIKVQVETFDGYVNIYSHQITKNNLNFLMRVMF